MYYSINNKLCKECGECKKECYLNLENANRVDPGKCDCCGCGHCYMVCPFGAIEMQLSQQKQRKYELGSIPPAELMAFLVKRRSYRRFKKTDIDNNTISTLVEAACSVPSGGNSHAYEFMAVKNEGIKEQLKKEIMQVYSSKLKILKSDFLKLIAKPFLDKQTRALLKGKTYVDRIEYMLKRFSGGEDLVFYNAPVIIIIHSKVLFPTPKEDAVLAGYNLNLYAESLGLGACFVTLVQYAVNTSTRCKKILGLTKEEQIHAALVLGYPAGKYNRIPLRPKKRIAYR